MSRAKAFTLVELMVAVLVSSILIGMTVQLYGLFRLSLARDSLYSDAAQNARVALDRLSREVRQAKSIVTVFPESESDTSVPQPSEIEFEDGHADDLTYRRYYIVGTTLRLDIKEYYFPASPNTRVAWNVVNASGNLPVPAVISSQDVAELVQDMRIYARSETAAAYQGGANANPGALKQFLTVEVDTGDAASQNYRLRTTIVPRNL